MQLRALGIAIQTERVQRPSTERPRPHHAAPIPSPRPAPAKSSPTRVTPQAPLRALEQRAGCILDHLQARSADQAHWPEGVDRYFAAAKHHQVKVVRALLRDAMIYAQAHAQHPGLKELLNSDDFTAWVTAPGSLEQAYTLRTTPPPGPVVPGVMHRLRNAMVSLQLLRENWPADL